MWYFIRSHTTLSSFSLVFLLLSTISCRQQPSQQEQETAEHGHHGESNTVSLTAIQVRSASVVVGEPEQKNLNQVIKVSGKLEVPAQNKAVVTSLYPGVLQSIRVHPGSQVRKGQAIATVANTELAGLQQQLIAATAELKLARLEYERQKDLVAGNAAPVKNRQKAEAELSSIKARHIALEQQLSALGINPSSVSNGSISSVLTLKSPINGTISDIRTQIGAQVNTAVPVATIVNNSQLHLDLFVYEKDLPSLKTGQVIHFTLTNNPVKEYDAEIFSIGTAFADASRAVPVHAEVQGDKTGLIEGMNVTAVVSVGNRTAAAVPDEAIVSSEGKDYIFIVKDHGADDHHEAAKAEETTIHFERVQVVRGASDLGFTEIQPVKDLPPGTRIAIKGAFFILAKMTNTGGHEH
jgi:membrane fusion protein, heavy metal efflux system